MAPRKCFWKYTLENMIIPAEVAVNGMNEPNRSRPTAGTPSTVAVDAPEPESVQRTASIEDLEIGYDEETGARIAREIEDATLPADLADLYRGEGVLGDRSLFKWKWIYYICGDVVTLPSVPDRYAEVAQEAKFLVGTYVTLMDDLAEKYADDRTFWELAKVAHPGESPDWEADHLRTDYARAVRRVWAELEARIESAPQYDALRESFEFDLRATVQSMDFARLSRGLSGHANRTETWRYETVAIGGIPTADIDLMFSPTVDPDDHRQLREFVHELQYLWRLGNWITTWRREIPEGDFSAGIVLEAVERGVVSRSDLEAVEAGTLPPERVVECIEDADVSGLFVAEWQRRRDELRDREVDLGPIDADAVVDDMEELMRCHLAIADHR